MNELATNKQNKPMSESCQICEGAGYIITEKNIYKTCQCVVDKIKENRLGFFKDVDLMKIEANNESQSMALSLIRQNPFDNYYIFGNVRLGKTHITAGIFNYVFDNFTSHIEWFKDTELRQYFIDVDTNTTDDWLTGGIKKKELKMIFIDDLGKAIAKDCYLQGMYKLIDEIYIHECKLVVSSVFSLEELNNIYGASIVRRIEDMAGKVIRLK